MSTVSGGEAQVVRPEGRWPANLCHDGSDEVLACFPQSDGQCGDLNGQSEARVSKGIYGDMPAPRDMPARGDSGSAARFFFNAKTSRTEREEGLERFDLKRRSDGREKDIENPRLRTTSRANHHPTVKPVALMRWLVRLVTPVGGTAIDPFMGSGSTGIACVCEDRGFIGFEREAEYFEIAKARVDYSRGELFVHSAP
jgi:site-specific DNA-methyltransferase (adenine-specific)